MSARRLPVIDDSATMTMEKHMKTLNVIITAAVMAVSLAQSASADVVLGNGGKGTTAQMCQICQLTYADGTIKNEGPLSWNECDAACTDYNINGIQMGCVQASCKYCTSGAGICPPSQQTWTGVVEYTTNH